MALYSNFGFSLHPVVAAWGHLRPGAVTRPPDVTRFEADQVTESQLDIVTAIDRQVRGSARTIDVEMMLSEEGNRLLLHGDQAYAVAKDERIVTLGAPHRGVGRTRPAHHAGRITRRRDHRGQLAHLGPAVGHPRVDPGRDRAAAVRTGDGTRHERPAHARTFRAAATAEAAVQRYLVHPVSGRAPRPS